MNKFKITMVLFALFQLMSRAQNNYGEFSYFHNDNSLLSSGVTASLAGQRGFILAGYSPSSSQFNFAIDRTDIAGAFNGNSWEFQNEYQVFADVTGGCNFSNASQLTTCHGVTIIETQVFSLSAWYAITAAFDEGFFFTFLDNNGLAIGTNIFFFPFPGSQTGVTKPMILEDVSSPNEYFICGSYNSIMYVLHVDIFGNPTWSNTYAISGEPRAITLSAAGDLVIVGSTTINTDVDGFIIELDATTGNSNFFETFDYNNYSQQFSSIAPALNPGVGYVIGGVCEVSPGASLAYNLNVDPSATVNWDNVIYSNADATAGDVVGIVERSSSTFGWEYFGVMSSTVGIMVLRMDDNGVPTWTGSGPLNRSDEFVYDAPGAALGAAAISYRDGTTIDEGIHIFGTDFNSSSAGHYLAQAYFSGHSGCNVPGFHFATWAGVCTPASNTLGNSAGPVACKAIYINSTSTNSKVDYCGPSSSVSNANNNRMALTDISSNSLGINLSVGPNPVTDIINVTCFNCHEITEIGLYDCLGQRVLHLKEKDINYISEADISIRASNLGIDIGTYFLNVKTDRGNVSKKIIFIRE